MHNAPRPDPARLHRPLYPVLNVVQARYGDMDANGHLNNLALESMHEDVRAVMNSQAFPGVYDASTRPLRLVAAQHVVHFLAESYWPANIESAGGIGRIGRTSFIVCTALFLDGECISVCDTVLVALGADGPTPLPEASRAALEALRLRIESHRAITGSTLKPESP
ncbi:acyl-CoA thioesterase [Mycolicibacterium fluoranthenivorans]|nr:acyl-CoA thioesterase [Mycolicibacterium fluoranthenivorans]